MAKRKTHLRLDYLTLGLLRYFKENGETQTNYELIDILVETYAEHYAEINELDFEELKIEALELQEQAVRPQTTKTKEENRADALKSLAKATVLTGKRKPKGVLDANIEDEVDDDFMSNFE